tara:strand:- start:2312 stop:2539 length:228 start_codon:yes stop_codon:yes gene_type:complete
MAKKTVIDSKLLETIDDHIYKHLPIHKITEMVDKRVEELSSKILSDVNDKINQRIEMNNHSFTKPNKVKLKRRAA